ncbi:hypothetical protein PMKS-001143 [Pichia membranifaciens]|uniref:Karyogamy protein n=1 Tax=Pichia membranifaciens TaxID=4926 RepID=A0A1Q2YDS8_9ASCO|nr:hypothetical protein PMKS-001143 [Pichia membranifaciens]
MSSYAAVSISSLIRKSFNLAEFNDLIDIEKENAFTTEQFLTETSLLSLQETSSRIVSSLNELRRVLQNIDQVGKQIEYQISWVFEGRIELSKIFTSIDTLEINVNLLLSKFQDISNPKTKLLLEAISSICSSNLEIKRLISPYKKRLAIANHHNEIEKEVLGSVKNEIIYCAKRLDELNKKKQVIDVRSEIQNWTLNDIIVKKKELAADLTSNYNGLIVFPGTDAQIFDSYTTLHDNILPISQSLKLIPKALEDFYHNARIYYQNLILENIENYEQITASYEKYRQDLRTFKSDYITHRINLICESIFEKMNTNQGQSNSILEGVLDVLKPIENYYGLSENYSAKLKSIEDKFYNIPLEENVQTPPPKNRKVRSKRVFSNPLVDSLNMKPILSQSRIKKRPEVKIFQTPRSIDDDIHMKANTEILERIKTEIGDTSILSVQKIPFTPLTLYSPQSSDSSPDTMRTRNIFDSPDPFITPNSRSFQKSRLPISTPLTTPRITPTKNHTSAGEELKRKQDLVVKGNVHTPLLRFELSTIIKVDPKTKETGFSTSEATRDMTKLSLTQSQIPTSPKLKVCHESPSTETSKIPLPKRPESRLDMLRSVSRLQTDRIKNGRSSSLGFGRSDSRLENIASTISMKLGTDSPVSISEAKLRPSTVMAQRELKQYGRPLQLRHLTGSYSGQLRNMKTRGATSLGARTVSSQSRISSI